MYTVYLDTQMYAYLSDPAHELSRFQPHLLRLVQRGAWRVLGSLALIEEFVGWARSDVYGYCRGKDLLWNLCGEKILLSVGRLLQLEMKKGRTLSLAEATVDEDQLNSLVETTNNTAEMSTFSSPISRDKKTYVRDMHDAVQEVDTFATEQEWTRKTIQRGASKLDIDEEFIKEWVHNGLVRPRLDELDLGPVEETWPRAADMPCCRAFASIYGALMKLRHQENRRDDPSDLYDQQHYLLASMGDAFVTCDARLRKTADLIAWRPLQVLGAEEFAHAVQTGKAPEHSKVSGATLRLCHSNEST